MTKEALKLALEALEEAADAIDSWGSYASGYFQVKHDLENDISKAKSAITAIKEALAQPEQDGKCKYCTDGCHACDARKLPEQEPVAWVGLDLDNMAEAFHRVIEEHHSRKNPFHDPVNGDAMLALRELRGLVAYMKRNTTPPQRTWVGLTDDEVGNLSDFAYANDEEFVRNVEKHLKEKNSG